MPIDIDKLKVFLKDPDKKPYYQIIYEALKAGFREKEFPGHYFSKLLYRKGVDNYLDYVGSFRGKRVAKSLKDKRESMVNVLANKLYFNYFFEDKEVKIPQMIGYNHGNVFIKDDRNTKVNSVEEFSYLIKKWGEGRDIFVKPIYGKQGQNCFKLSTNTNNFKITDDIYRHIVNDCYIYQEIIKQHDVINEIYADAVNPLRIVSYIDDKNNLHFIASFMTFGINKNDVSNNSSGGIFVTVDLGKGELKGKAVQYLDYGGLQYIRHPESGIKFDGFKIPYFKETLKMIEKALEYLPIRYAGWDVAITENGPCIIEGNSYPAMASMDIGYGGLKKHPILGQIIKKF